MGNRSFCVPTAATEESATLYCSIELSRKSWVVAVCMPLSDKVSLHRFSAGDSAGLLALLERWRGKAARRVNRSVRVVCCYEAGYDGFWLHRVLTAAGLEAHVMDPASLQVNRRARRAKTDRIDAKALLRALMAYCRGDRGVCSMVRVPTPEEEDAKRLNRERARLVKERTQHVNRIKGLLAGQGIYDFQPRRRDAARRLAGLVTGDGRPLLPVLKGEIERHLDRLALLERQIADLESKRDVVFDSPAKRGSNEAKIQQLARLKAIGPAFSTGLVREVFYRRFENRRQLGAYSGLTPSPFASGDTRHDQGISKAGNARARTTLVELAWLWLRYQPQSALSHWFHDRVQGRTGRVKRIAIVALARKLLIALWRYLELGLVPDGARLKV